MGQVIQLRDRTRLSLVPSSDGLDELQDKVSLAVVLKVTPKTDQFDLAGRLRRLSVLAREGAFRRTSPREKEVNGALKEGGDLLKPDALRPARSFPLRDRLRLNTEVTS